MVPVSITEDGVQKNKIDTTFEGPVYWTAGLGYSYQLSDVIYFKGVLDFMHLIALDVSQPDHSPSLQIDVHLGFEFAF